MSLKGKFKQKLYKEDLVPVIKQGIFVAFVGGLLIGAINLLVTYLSSFSVIWMLCIIMAFYIAKRIRNAYMQYHIWYSVIAILSFMIGFWWLNVVSNAGILFIYNVTDIYAYVSILDPLPYFSFLLPWTWFYNTQALISGILNFIFFGISIYYAYRNSK